MSVFSMASISSAPDSAPDSVGRPAAPSSKSTHRGASGIEVRHVNNAFNHLGASEISINRGESRARDGGRELNCHYVVEPACRTWLAPINSCIRRLRTVVTIAMTL